MKKLQRGSTLIELMISMALSLGLIAGICSLFVQMQKSNKVQRSFSAIADDSTYAQEVIQKEIRRAGGLRSARDINGTANVIFLGGVKHTNELGSGINFLQGEYIKGKIPNPATDSFIMRYQLTDARDLSAAALGSGSSSCIQNVLINDPTAANPGPALTNEDPANDAHVVSVYFFLDGNGTLSCTAQRTQQILTNETCVRNCTSSTDYSSTDDYVPLITTVTKLSVKYGVDSDSDGAANFYVSADDVPTADPLACTASANNCWRQIVSIRLSMLFRSPEDHLVDVPMTYLWEGATETATDFRLYKSFTSTIALRNI